MVGSLLHFKHFSQSSPQVSDVVGSDIGAILDEARSRNTYCKRTVAGASAPTWRDSSGVSPAAGAAAQPGISLRQEDLSRANRVRLGRAEARAERSRSRGSSVARSAAAAGGSVGDDESEDEEEEEGAWDVKGKKAQKKLAVKKKRGVRGHQQYQPPSSASGGDRRTSAIKPFPGQRSVRPLHQTQPLKAEQSVGNPLQAASQGRGRLSGRIALGSGTESDDGSSKEEKSADEDNILSVDEDWEEEEMEEEEEEDADDDLDELRLQEEGEFLHEDGSNGTGGLGRDGSCEEGRWDSSTDASATEGHEGVGYVRRRMRGGKEQPVVVCMVGEPNVSPMGWGSTSLYTDSAKDKPYPVTFYMILICCHCR